MNKSNIVNNDTGNYHINGNTRVCGLIGHPVGHTLSPDIHNFLAKQTGIDLVYVPFEVMPGTVKAAVEGAYDLNILGLNVTVPHKIEVIDALKDIDPEAKAIGAVNTLVRTEGGYKGYNTDHIGLKRALSAEGVDLHNNKLVVLGAGGAARSAAFLGAFSGASDIYVLNRNYDRAVALCRDVNDYAGCNGLESESESDELCKPLRLEDYSLIDGDELIVIQASSVGMVPNQDAVIIEDEEFYDRMQFGFDVVYKPGVTRFMQLATKHGKKNVCGLTMLLYQGIAAYELWNGITVDTKTANDCLCELKKALGPVEETR